MEIVSFLSPGTLALLVILIMFYRNPWIIDAMHAMGNEYNSMYIDEEEEEESFKQK